MKFKNNIKNIRARNLISLLHALNYSDFCGKKKKVHKHRWLTDYCDNDG